MFSALDPFTNPANEQVRVGVYSIDPSASKAAATIVSQGSDQGTYLAGTDVVDHAISYLAEPGLPQNLALLTEGPTALNLLYLAPLTGASQGGIAIALTTGGISLDGI